MFWSLKKTVETHVPNYLEPVRCHKRVLCPLVPLDATTAKLEPPWRDNDLEKEYVPVKNEPPPEEKTPLDSEWVDNNPWSVPRKKPKSKRSKFKNKWDNDDSNGIRELLHTLIHISQHKPTATYTHKLTTVPNMYKTVAMKHNTDTFPFKVFFT